MRTWTYAAFGLTVESPMRFAGLHHAADGLHASPDVFVRMAADGEIDRRWSGTDRPPVWRATLSDEAGLTLEHGREGDHRFFYDGGSAFHLSADASTVLCAPHNPDSPGWQRVLLDSVLFSTAVIRGYEAIHAAGVELPGGVIALGGASGSGKSTLTAELIARGASFFADDVLALDRQAGAVRAHPGPPLMNLPHDQPLPSGKDGAASVVATFRDERWVFVPRPATPARQVTAVFLLRPDGEARVEPCSPAVLALLGCSLRFPHVAGRAQKRFDLLATMAETTPVFRLHGSLHAPRDVLADLVLEAATSVAQPAGAAVFA